MVGDIVIDLEDLGQQGEKVEAEKANRLFKYFYITTALTICALLIAVVVRVPKALMGKSNSEFESTRNQEDQAINGLAPTSTLTFRPTSQPSTFVTSQPSYQHSSSTIDGFDPEEAFKIRLFWQHGYYWQENWDESFFCIECTACDEYGYLDGWVHGCKKYKPVDNAVDQCKINDQFWIMPCDDRSTYFNIIDNGSALQIKINGTNLCMERGATQSGQYRSRVLRVRECDLTRDKQLFAPVSNIDRFEMRSYKEKDWTEDDADCVSQLHHPKDGEVLSFQNCKLDRIYETRYWETYSN